MYGASAISGKLNGVPMSGKFTHHATHGLNLAIREACSGVHIRKWIAVLNIFIKILASLPCYKYKRVNVFNITRVFKEYLGKMTIKQCEQIEYIQTQTQKESNISDDQVKANELWLKPRRLNFRLWYLVSWTDFLKTTSVTEF
jgi:hypothetical protein